jgi:hypothetical protein
MPSTLAKTLASEDMSSRRRQSSSDTLARNTLYDRASPASCVLHRVTLIPATRAAKDHSRRSLSASLYRVRRGFSQKGKKRMPSFAFCHRKATTQRSQCWSVVGDSFGALSSAGSSVSSWRPDIFFYFLWIDTVFQIAFPCSFVCTPERRPFPRCFCDSPLHRLRSNAAPRNYQRPSAAPKCLTPECQCNEYLSRDTPPDAGIRFVRNAGSRLPGFLLLESRLHHPRDVRRLVDRR